MNKILILEDNKKLAEFYKSILKKVDYNVITSHNSFDFINIYNNFQPDLVILDIKLNNSQLSGLDVFKQLVNQKKLRSKVIILSGEATRSEIAQAMKLGAYTFIEKTGDFNIDKFLADVRQAINLKIQEEKNISLEEDKEFLRKRFLEQMPLIGESSQIEKVRNLIQKFARADINALLIGESGTGKEIVANNIYWQSKRAGKPYVAVNAGAFTETLIDSELFGHRKGSFTGAISDKKGYFEQANKGTLFLDEISNLSKSTQAKILRAIEYNEIQIVGGEIKNINVNFIFASNKELDKLVEENQFREDLYYRLEGNTIYIPPLRERGDDIILLMDYFFSKFSQKHESVVDVNLKDIKNNLLSFHWPGNVRELEKFCEYLFVLYDFIDNSIILEEFKKKVQGNLKKQNAALHQLLGIENHAKAINLIEKKYLQYHLSINNGNVTTTANKIGLDRSTLYKKIKKYEMD